MYKKITLTIDSWKTRLELLLRTDISYLVTNGGWLVVGQIAIAFVAFFLSVAFARFVPKESYGTYRFLLSMFWTLTAFSLTGLPTVVTQLVARGYEGVYKKAFPLSFLWGLPMFIIGLGACMYYLLHGNTELGYGFLIMAIVGPFIQGSLLYGSFLEGKKDFKTNTILGIVLSTGPAVVLLVSMFFTESPLVFFSVYLVSNAVIGLLLGIFVYVKNRPNTKVESGLNVLSGHFSLMNLLWTVSQQIDKLLVFHYLGAVELAIYSFAIAMPEQIRAILNNIGNLAFPKFAQRSIEEIRGNFWGRLWSFTGMLGIFFPAYIDAVFYSQLFAISLIMTSNTIPTTLLQAHAAKKELYIFNIVSPVFQISFLIWLTIVYGLLGTIIARIIGRLFSLLLSSLLVREYILQHLLKKEK